MSITDGRKIDPSKDKIKIGVLHGAITNAGDFLILERGKRLLENFFNENFEFTYLLRSEPFTGEFDALILLGGPLITRKLHPQSKNVINYIKDKNIPIFCIGLGISGEKFQSYKDYFLDKESILFWKYIYETTHLFSVRDLDTYNVLKNYGIDAELTGCPALFDLQHLRNTSRHPKNGEIQKIAVTVPNITIYNSKIVIIITFLKVVYLFYLLSKHFNDKDIVIFFQHGYNGLNRISKLIATMFGFESYDIAGKSLEKSSLKNFDVHIGVRLHAHIYFLSIGKPSFLLSVDARTDSFLKTIKTPHDRFTIYGIRNVVNMLKNTIYKKNFDEFNIAFSEIKKYFFTMKKFLKRIESFYGGELHETNKN